MTQVPALVASQPARWRRAAAFAALFALMYMAFIGLHPFTELTKSTAEERGGGNMVDQLWYPLVLVGIIAIGRPLHDPRRLLAIPFSLAVALGWCALSLSWAYAPGVGVRRLVLTSVVIFSIFRAVDELGVDRSIAAMRFIMGFVLLLNYVFMVISPISIHTSNEPGAESLVGAWRGAMAHKNFAGAASAATVLAFAFGGRGPAGWLRVAVALAAAFFLVETQSKTSIGLLALALAVGFGYLRYDARYRSLWLPAAAIAVVLLGYGIVRNYDRLVAPLYGQTGVSGRVQIWEPMLRFIGDHWLAGAGFGSFWNIGQIGPIDDYTKGWAADVGNGHQGYLDLATQVGLPGLALVVFATTIAPIARLLATRRIDRRAGALALALLIFCAGHNFTETSMFDRASIVQVVMMLAVAMTYQLTRLQRLTPRAGRAPASSARLAFRR